MLITESALNPYSNRAKIAEIFFESFGVPAIYFENQAVLSLYAQGKTTGVVVDVGDGVTQIAPIVDGFCVKKAVRRQDLGGRDVTAYLMQLLQRSGLTGFHTSAEFQICQDIKEKFCEVSEKSITEDFYTADISGSKGKQYILPDGNGINITMDV